MVVVATMHSHLLLYCSPYADVSFSPALTYLGTTGFTHSATMSSEIPLDVQRMAVLRGKQTLEEIVTSIAKSESTHEDMN